MKFNRRPKDDFFQQTSGLVKGLIREHEKAASKIQKKMPLKMMLGIRKKESAMQQKEKEFNRQSQILYNSYTASKSKKAFVADHKDAGKQNNERGKEDGMKRGLSARQKNFEFKDGVLTIHKRVIDRR